MDGNKDHVPVTGQAQTVETQATQYSVEKIIELLVKLPAFARQPVCRFTIEGQPVIGQLVKKRDSTLYIKHRFGKKAIPYKMEQLQAIKILHL